MDTSQLSKAIGCSLEKADNWLIPLMDACHKYEINTKLRLAAFISQISHESAHLSALEENLNYSTQALLTLFGKYFTNAQAEIYQRRPPKIASRIYANRMGNGDENSADGWAYRGRGPIQITGRDNYKRCGDAIGIDLIAEPYRLVQPEAGSLSAAWYWGSVNANKYADIGDIDGVSDVVNKGRKTSQYGDALGFADRLSIYKKALSIL